MSVEENKLRISWDVYFDVGFVSSDWKEDVKRIGSFGTLERWWRIWNNIPFKNFPEYCNLRIFKAGISPAYESKDNINGGKLVSKTDVIHGGAFLEVSLQIILEFIGKENLESAVTGIVFGFRKSRLQVQVWERKDDGDIYKRVSGIIKRFPKMSKVKYLKHDVGADNKSPVSGSGKLEYPPTAKPKKKRKKRRRNRKYREAKSFDDREENNLDDLNVVDSVEMRNSTLEVPPVVFCKKEKYVKKNGETELYGGVVVKSSCKKIIDREKRKIRHSRVESEGNGSFPTEERLVFKIPKINFDDIKNEKNQKNECSEIVDEIFNVLNCKIEKIEEQKKIQKEKEQVTQSNDENFGKKEKKNRKFRSSSLISIYIVVSMLLLIFISYVIAKTYSR